MRAAVEDVEHGGGKNAGIDAAEIAIERNLESLRNGAGSGHGYGEDGVGAEFAFIGCAVESDHGLIEQALVGCIQPFDFWGNDAFDVGDGLEDALAEVVGFVAIAEFHSLVLAGGGARRHNGAALSAAFEDDISFHGRISARVEYFAGANGNNFSHMSPHNAVL